MSQSKALIHLGWQLFFQSQVSNCDAIPARVIDLYKTEITVLTEKDQFNLTLLPNMPELVVGDWLLLTPENKFSSLLKRKTQFSRKAPGSKLKKQLIASNVDIAFIVTSMNEDFNLNRIERFLVLVNESGAKPIILLSKKDKATHPEQFITAVQSLDETLEVNAINCLEKTTKAILLPWLKDGITIAMLGSSGVGKSTLINTLLGENRQATGEIRADDKKGRHTTTRRSLIPLDTGGLILDTPGIREVQLTDCKIGLSMTFQDIEGYRKQCKFKNCTHRVEPGCAVQKAIESGALDTRRLKHYFELQKEDTDNTKQFSQKKSKKTVSTYEK